MSFFNQRARMPALLLAGLVLPVSAAQASKVTLTFSNLSGGNGVALSPFFVAFHDGSFDAFDIGSPASSAIEAIAEAGDGAGLAANFSANHPTGMSYTLTASSGGFGPGIFLPGATGSISVDLDPVKNRYLSYFSMVVPSNDRFLGNDTPTEIALFDDQGHFTGGSFQDNGDSIWDAGTELDGPTGAAFLVGYDAGLSPAQNGVIQANHDFSAYSGLATPAGYNFTNLPGADTPLLKIDAVSAVPVPAAIWLFGSALPLMGFMRKSSRSIQI